jgi:hypothetical protein
MPRARSTAPASTTPEPPHTAPPAPAEPQRPSNIYVDDPMAILRWQGDFGAPVADFAKTTASMASLPTEELRGPRRPKTTRYKGITRIDHPPKSTFGYFVRVTWNKVTHSKFFSDKVYGDRLAALASAIDWRDATEKAIGKPRSERQVIGAPRTGTGIVGVRRVIKDGREVYEATWRENNRVRRTSFSIAKHGERKARSLARQAREQRESTRRTLPRE